MYQRPEHFYLDGNNILHMLY